MTQQQRTFDLLSKAQFEIGGKDQLAGVRSKSSAEPQDEPGRQRLEADWERLFGDLQIRTGTLLKIDTVSFLLGAGASKECGGLLIGTIPLDLERELLNAGITDKAAPWLESFYVALRRVGGDNVGAPSTQDEILQRRDLMSDEPNPVRVNLEALLSLLHRWRSPSRRRAGAFDWMAHQTSICVPTSLMNVYGRSHRRWRDSVGCRRAGPTNPASMLIRTCSARCSPGR